jgi:hypothetical protein
MNKYRHYSHPEEKDDKSENENLNHLKSLRRIYRLYGSNAKNLKRGRQPPSSQHEQQHELERPKTTEELQKCINVKTNHSNDNRNYPNTNHDGSIRLKSFIALSSFKNLVNSSDSHGRKMTPETTAQTMEKTNKMTQFVSKTFLDNLSNDNNNNNGNTNVNSQNPNSSNTIKLSQRQIEQNQHLERFSTAKSRVPKFMDKSQNHAMITTNNSGQNPSHIQVHDTQNNHEDNHIVRQMNRPWYVGYQNTSSVQGSPIGIAARYGYNGALKVTKQASSRLSMAGIESAYIFMKCDDENTNEDHHYNTTTNNHKDGVEHYVDGNQDYKPSNQSNNTNPQDTHISKTSMTPKSKTKNNTRHKKMKNIFESNLISVNEWNPPLKAAPHGVTLYPNNNNQLYAGDGNFSSTPKLWPDFMETKKIKKKRQRDSIILNSCSNSTNVNENSSPPMVTTAAAINTRQLERVMSRESYLWQNISKMAQRERNIKSAGIISGKGGMMDQKRPHTSYINRRPSSSCCYSTNRRNSLDSKRVILLR